MLHLIPVEVIIYNLIPCLDFQSYVNMCKSDENLNYLLNDKIIMDQYSINDILKSDTYILRKH